MAKIPPIEIANVKVMRSYDYCHFEVNLGTSLAHLDTEQEDKIRMVDDMRKEAARLVDKAVKQYKIAKEDGARRFNVRTERDELKREVEEIEKLPEGDRTANQMAKVKLLNDLEYWDRREREYDYEDDWNDDLNETTH